MSTEDVIIPEHYKYLCSQVEMLEMLPYFENIKKYPNGSFLLGMHNIVSVIREHNLHIAVATTKVDSELNVKILAKILFVNTGGTLNDSNPSIAEQFKNFLIQFRDKSYPETYYKKYSAMSPIDKLSDDLCQIILDKTWVQVIASLATFELVLSKISIKFNDCVNNILDNTSDPILLNPTKNKENCMLLLNMLEEQDKHDIINGVVNTVNSFNSFFSEIDSQFYYD